MEGEIVAAKECQRQEMGSGGAQLLVFLRKRLEKDVYDSWHVRTDRLLCGLAQAHEK